MAQLLKHQGYSTGMAGKWHLGHHPRFLPVHHGFDEYLGLPYSNDMWPFHPEAKPGAYPPLPLIEGDRIVNPNVTAKEQSQLTGLYTERAVSFINRHKDHPFFFYLAHSMPHVPLHVGEGFKGKSKQGLYGDVIEEIDASVGKILQALKLNGIEKDTLVIFTTDNGPWLSYGDHAGTAGPLREGKGTCWEGGVRVPCIMRWPGKIPAGTESDAMLMTIDLFPTIARLVGAELPKHAIDGLDVWPLLAGQPGAINPHDAYLYYYEQNQLQAVVTGDGHWKLQLPHNYRSLAGLAGGHGGVPTKYKQVKIIQPELYDLATRSRRDHRRRLATHRGIEPPPGHRRTSPCRARRFAHQTRRSRRPRQDVSPAKERLANRSPIDRCLRITRVRRVRADPAPHDSGVSRPA